MNTDIIELSLPFKAEYVSIARLTASGVANRIGFDMEAIEDIKVALSEVCNKLIKIGSSSAESYRIIFKLMENELNIKFWCKDESLRCIFNDNDNELGISIINALMDEVLLCSEDGDLMLMSITVK